MSTTATTGRTAEQRDEATARTLARVALCFVVAWAGVAVLDGAIRLVDTMRLRAANRGGQGWDSIAPLGLEILLSMLWFAALGALALGVAMGVAALVLGKRRARVALLVALVVAGAAAQVLFIDLTAGVAWSFSGDVSYDGRLVAAVGTVAVPVVALVVTWAVLDPVLRRRRSTREPAEGG